MGVVGLTLEDFCYLSPDEFAAICKAHNEQRESEMQAAWNRMRLHACISIQPHVKNKLTPEKLLPFTWDAGEKEKVEAKKVSKEEAKRRFEKLAGKVKNQKSLS